MENFPILQLERNWQMNKTQKKIQEYDRLCVLLLVHICRESHTAVPIQLSMM